MNRKLASRVALSTALASTLLLLACSDEVTSTTASEDVIGGTPAEEAEYDAVVRVAAAGGGGCSGVLVAPSVVLTAAHCVENFDSRGQVRLNSIYLKGKTYHPTLVMRVGPDRNRHFVYERSLVDAALVLLESPVPSSEATPIPLRSTTLDATDIGKKLTVVGYGWTEQRKLEAVQPRTKGTLTLNAVSGKHYQQAFASFADFQNYLREMGEPASFVDGGDALELWEQSLPPDEELVYVGAQPGDAQMCFGDSGGPLLERVGGELRVVGLASSGDSGKQNPCLAGGFFTRIDDQLANAVATFAAEGQKASGCRLAPRRPADRPYDFDLGSTCMGNVLSSCTWNEANMAGQPVKLAERQEVCPSGTTCQIDDEGTASCATN